MLRAWLMRFAGMFGKRRREREFVEELESHLQFHVEDNLRRGMSREEARRKALIKLGGLEQTKEICRERLGLPFIDTFLQDVRYGLRQLRRNPGFTVTGILTLALGIGSVTAIFGVMDALLLRPLPYPEGNQLVTLWQRNLQANVPRGYVSAANFYDWQKQSQGSFAALTAFAPWPLNLSGAGSPERLNGVLVTPRFFSVLGVKPAQGRTFVAGEDDPARAAVAVASDALWRRLFGAGTRLAQQTITIDGTKTLIVGVMPPGFSFPSDGIELWIPLALSPANRANREGGWLQALGRLRDGIGVRQAQGAMDVIARRIEQNNPRTQAGWGISLVPLREQQVGNLRPRLWLMLGAVALLLLAACTNVASLLLARALETKREIAVRAAIGATRARVARQLMTESFLLGIAGGGGGILLAHWILMTANGAFAQAVPSAPELKMDPVVLGFAFLLTAGSTALCGLVPALQAANVNLHHWLKSGRRSATGYPRARRTLVAAQIAVSYVLLMGAGLLSRSLIKLLSVDPGFETRNTLALDLSLPRSRYPNSQRQIQFAQEVLQRIRGLAGVEHAGAVSDLPMRGNTMTFPVAQEGQSPQAGDELEKVGVRWITPDYFAAMKIGVLRGRLIGERDNANSLPVAVVNHAMVRRLWPGGLRLGTRLRLAGDPRWFSVVGVVNDVHQIGLDAEEVPALYLPYLQKNQDWLNWMTLVVHTSSKAEELANAIQMQIWGVDRDQPVTRIATMADYVAESVALPRFTTVLASGFSLAALLITLVGLYGVMAYSVSQRKQEFGVRAALGASAGEIRRLVLWQGGKLALAGLGCGVAAALLITRSLQSLLFKTSVTDPLTLLSTGFVLIAVAVTACYIPAHHATQVDPMAALRYE